MWINIYRDAYMLLLFKFDKILKKIIKPDIFVYIFQYKIKN